ncbi:TauD/TfdA family dioxygenase [Cobetia amphilecti]|uniref:TauD/TfdA family dioxygenase n=1 Tax=Cobetia amphilecti TaxID=1055104 RepID=A0AAP4WY03_9GAMM|nr:TauD/TfdA family dioxygenase [Cobetia amphilecti]MDO6672907.1 TauD/TfdA family dioxygenase [Cobetia amphilecti]
METLIASAPDTQDTEASQARHQWDMKEYLPHHEGAPLVKADHDETLASLAWASGEQTQLPLIWLRDHCACDLCRHPQTFERTFMLMDDAALTVHQMRVEQGNLVVVWQDGHTSRFDAGWLLQRRPSDAPPATPVPASQAWQQGHQPHVTAFADYMSGGQARLGWLEALCRDGFAILDAGPTAGGEIDQVAATIGPIRATNFGGRFEVFSKQAPNNAAYTPIALELHTDLPNWRQPPDIQMLYCLANEAEGGDSIFGDGMAVAEALRERDPQAFRLLAETPVDFRFADETTDLVVREPVIHLDANDKVIEVRFNNWIRDSLRLPLEQMQAWYSAYRQYWSILREPAFRLHLKLEAGQMVAFDNRRVMHGRKSFDPTTGRRHLQGCYVDYDMVESALRVTARQLAGANLTQS